MQILFKSQNDFNKYVESEYGTNYSSIVPSIDSAQDKYIIPIFGGYFFTLLNAYSNNTATATEKTLIGLLQPAIALLALSIYIPHSDVTISANGIMRTESDNQKSAWKYQVDNLQTSYTNRGLEKLDIALAYAEANIANLSGWASDESYSNWNMLWINKGAELQTYCSNIRFGSRLYLLLRSTIYDVQELAIRPSIGDDVYLHFMNFINTNTLQNMSIKEKAFFVFIKRALANIAMHKGIPKLVANMDENGIHILGNGTSTNDSLNKRQSAKDSVLSLVLDSYESLGTQWLDKANTFLYDNLAPDFFADRYAAKLEKEKQVPVPNINVTSKALFGM